MFVNVYVDEIKRLRGKQSAGTVDFDMARVILNRPQNELAFRLIAAYDLVCILTYPV